MHHPEAGEVPPPRMPLDYLLQHRDISESVALIEASSAELDRSPAAAAAEMRVPRGIASMAQDLLRQRTANLAQDALIHVGAPLA